MTRLNLTLTSASPCRLWERCSSFFDLICWLLEQLSIEQQQVYSVDVAGLLDSETTLMEELCKYRGPSEWKEGKRGEGWTVRRRERGRVDSEEE